MRADAPMHPALLPAPRAAHGADAHTSRELVGVLADSLGHAPRDLAVQLLPHRLGVDVLACRTRGLLIAVH